ncbi:hypothetical protein NECID01_0707 [Nematocida sp. AWRm77]|nr:hypothetical protein NECID01_0707 [Nematocida sp. AWRm77]
MEKQKSIAEEESLCAGQVQVQEEVTAIHEEAQEHASLRAKKPSKRVLHPDEMSINLINQMKGEIRKLYGEKVNMKNTGYMIKPHEFQCISQALARGLGTESKELKTIDDVIYAIDCLVNKLAQTKEAGETQTQILEQRRAETTIRFSVDLLRRLVSSDLAGEASSQNKTLEESAAAANGAACALQSLLDMVHRPTVESLVVEKERTGRMLLSIADLYSISPGENLLDALTRIREKEQTQAEEEAFIEEKKLECQKRHYEECIARLNLSISEMVAENSTLKRLLQEKASSTAEMLQRSQTLEESIAQIRHILQEEEKKIEKERLEYLEIKESLVQKNKQMSKVVQELVSRIKEERKEKEELIHLQESK